MFSINLLKKFIILSISILFLASCEKPTLFQKTKSDAELKSMQTEAQSLYRNGELIRALDLFQRIEKLSNGKTTNTYGNLFSIYFKQGRLEEAEESFSKMLAIGVKKDNIPVKIVFESGKTTFLQNRELLKKYDIWLKQIAIYLKDNPNKCAYVIGHSSKNGNVDYNCKLSYARAEYVSNKILKTANVKQHLMNLGKSNQKASIKNNVNSAINRRVDFKIVNCNSSLWKIKEQGCKTGK
jgi:pentatricopeptide repeat protein